MVTKERFGSGAASGAGVGVAVALGVGVVVGRVDVGAGDGLEVVVVGADRRGSSTVQADVTATTAARTSEVRTTCWRVRPSSQPDGQRLDAVDDGELGGGVEAAADPAVPHQGAAPGGGGAALGDQGIAQPDTPDAG